MKSKFIKGTKEKYSIREDGSVVLTKVINTQKRKDRKAAGEYYELYIDGKKKKFYKNKLLADYYGFKYCTQCNCKFTIETTINAYKCQTCLKSNVNSSIENWKKNNASAVQKIRRNRETRGRVNIDRRYVCKILNLHNENLSEELYTHFKKTLLFKRTVAKQHGITINQIR
tara:strand:- start:9148 stop:9660 length:513 start_codon:yes stop_codon:yes gene_type:complete